MTAIIPLLVLGGIVVGIVFAVRKLMGRRATESGEGADLIAHLLLALAVGTVGFSLATLARIALPASDIVRDRAGQVATPLAGLVVAAPIAVYLWRRQARRRAEYPASGGWSLYLGLMEATFMTAFVITAFGLLDWLLADGDRTTWADVVVYGGVVVFHGLASRRTPPRSDSAELPRVIGSAIGLVATTIAVSGLFYWLFDSIYATVSPRAGEVDALTWVALLIVGGTVWYLRWWRSWPGEPGILRNTLLFAAAVAGLATSIGGATVTLVETLGYLFTDSADAAEHFDFLPVTLAAIVVGILAWAHHRALMGRERTPTVQSYQYAMTALGLAAMVGSTTWLVDLAFGSADLVGGTSADVIAAAVALAVAVGVWWLFWSRISQEPRETEAASTPRRFYLLGMGVVLGLISAGALIAGLVVVFQMILESAEGEFLAGQVALFVAAGLATWHLLHENITDRGLIESEEVITPFDVTIICSHPGMVSARFPKQAKLKVAYRGDDAGVIDEEMAEQIVTAVANKSSLVWVDEDGFRIAPAR